MNFLLPHLRSNILLICLLLVSVPCLADVRLPRLLSDGAILQRDKPLEIWGWADEGEKVTVQFAGKDYTGTTKSGRWSVTIPKQKAGGPHHLVIRGNNTIDLRDIWFGDLWIAAGQSNIELPLRRVAQRYPDVIPNTNLPQIRQFSVPLTYAVDQPREDYEKGSWKTAIPENLPEFSAVGFFFAKELWQQYQVPVGILSLSVGGSPVQAWVSEKVLQKYPHYLAEAGLFKNPDYLKNTIEKDKAASDAWYSKAQQHDKGLQAEKPWHKIPLDSQWKTLNIPGRFLKQNVDFANGVIWLKKKFELSAEQAKSPHATLWLGVLVDGDEAYINGVKVGSVGYQYPPRIYAVPQGTLKPGKNTVTVRLTSYTGNPGAVEDKTYALDLGGEKINLSGEWHYRVGMRAAGPMPATTTLHYLPGSLFKAKLAPAFDFNIKGVLWYQGESNVERSKNPHIPEKLTPTTSSAEEYKTLLPDLIRDWRNHFNQGDFPFLFVQLPNFLPAQAEPGESAWADLRQAQTAALKLKNTGMAVAIDTGEWNDIHPLNKKDIGHRLALQARKIAYDEKSLLASGPTVKSVKRKSNKLIVTFNNTGKGLQVHGESPQHIAIAGTDKKFVWAQAEMKGDKLVAWSEAVEKPVWVRYAWADNPEGANLYNSAGLPAGPFEVGVE